MELYVRERTPFIERILDVLRTYRRSEGGVVVEPRFLTAEDARRATVPVLVLTPSVDDFVGSVVGCSPDVGVLVLSARSCVESPSVLRSLLLERTLDPRLLCLFGTRAWGAEDALFCDARRVQRFSMIEISREGLSECTDAAMALVREWRGFCLVLDVGIVDPAFAPGLAASVPGGLTARELIYVFQRFLLIPSLRGVQLVTGDTVADAEMAPAAQLVAHLLAEAASR